MLPERLGAYLRYFTSLAEQGANRWSGFDLSAPEGRETSLRDQVTFAGLALAALALEPAVSADAQQRAREGLAALVERLTQRRIWAAWAGAVAQAGRLPDPIGEGGARFAGRLATLLGLYAAVGGDRRFDTPITLHWSSDFRFSYDHRAVAETLWRQARVSPDGAVASEGDLAHPDDMAFVLLALHLHDITRDSDYRAVGESWLATIRERLALRGPRLPGRNTLSSSYNLRRRQGSLTSDPLTDVWALALSAPLAPELTRALAARYWAGSQRIAARGSPLALAFSYLLAVELGEAERASALLAAIEARLVPVDDADGRRLSAAPAVPWLTAVIALGEAGGLGQLLARSHALSEDGEQQNAPARQ